MKSFFEWMKGVKSLAEKYGFHISDINRIPEDTWREYYDQDKTEDLAIYDLVVEVERR